MAAAVQTLAKASIPREIIVENPLNGSPVDLVVGIPSYNEADSIGFVTEQAAKGLEQCFPDLRGAVINADNFSGDGTRSAFFRSNAGRAPRTYLSTPPGVKGKGNNFKNLFEYLRPHRPKAVVVVDADLKSITPEWIALLAQPILDGFDFASPLYSRNEYDGTITNHLCYPLIFALLGKDIRQPIGGDFAFSFRLMEQWLRRDWSEAVRQYGVDIFMTTEAILGDFRLAQTALGSKVHKPSAPKLGPMFSQVIDTLFSQLSAARDRWKLNGKPSEVPPVFGAAQLAEPQSLGVDYKKIKKQALREFNLRVEEIRRILSDGLAEKIVRQFEKERFRINASTWAEVVYAFLRSYAKSENRRWSLEVVEALKPLYFARVTSFIKETLELSHQQSERKLRSQAETFRRRRGFLA